MKRSKVFFAVLTAALAVLALGPVSASFAGEPLRLDDLLREAEANSPKLAAMKAKYQAAYERVSQAGAMPDPMAGIGFENLPVDSFAFDREQMTGKVVELEQEFPFFGKRNLRREAARAEAASIEADYREEALSLSSEVKTAFYEIYALEKNVAVLDSSAEVLGSLGKTANAGYSVGTGAFRDMTKVELEKAMLADRKIALVKELRTKRAYLGSLVGRDAAVDGVPEDVAPSAVTLDRGALAARALALRPALLSSDAEIKKGSFMVEIARRDYYPDFTVKASYMERDTLRGGIHQPDMVSLMLSANLPIWSKSKLDPAVREAGFTKKAAEDEREAKVKEIYYRIDSLINEIAQDERTMKLYRDVVVPQAEADINAGLAGYSSGKAEFMGVLDSVRNLVEYRSGYYNAAAAREKALAELSATVGEDIK